MEIHNKKNQKMFYCTTMRDRDRDKERDRERDRERGRERENVSESVTEKKVLYFFFHFTIY